MAQTSFREQKLRTVALFIFLLLIVRLKSQELIPNGSFEEYRKCPGESSMLSRYSSADNCKYWYNPNKASPDYDNACTNHGMYGVPNNYGGKQYAKSGNGYFAVIYYSFYSLMEYIGVKLKEPLKENRYYCFKMHVSLADKQEYCVNQFQFALTKKKLKARNTKMLNFANYSVASNGQFLSDKENWTEIKGLYKASGDECFLTIGLFNNAIPLKYLGRNKNIKKKLDPTKAIIYYYIDDVSLVEVTEPSNCKCETLAIDTTENIIIDTVSKFSDAVKKPFVLKNVVFEVNESELLDTSFEELDELVEYLIEKKQLSVQLSGYTDNTGDESENLKLSEARAKAVMQYLIQKGIEAKRITYNGFGSKNPIVPNDTEENKQINRRVEMVLH